MHSKTFFGDYEDGRNLKKMFQNLRKYIFVNLKEVYQVY